MSEGLRDEEIALAKGVSRRPVFISYARRASRDAARALHEALGGADGPAFFDTTDIEAGDHFPRALGEGILNARVVVVFAADLYFQRWYCLRELRTALAPYDAARRGAGGGERAEALRCVLVALPVGATPAGFEQLPPEIQQTSWPLHTDTSVLARLVSGSLSRNSRTIGDQLGSAEARRILQTLLEESAIPPPLHFTGTPHWPPDGIPSSLGAGFLGRATDLAQLHLALSAPLSDGRASAPAGVVLAATGGFGKTRVAAEYLHRFGPAYYPGGLFWINGDQRAGAVEAQWHGVLQTLSHVPDLAAMRAMGRSVTKELAQAFAAQPPDRPVLVVLDNVPESVPGDPLRFEDLCPALGFAPLIITSRQRISLPGVRVHILDILPQDSAVLLLTRDVPGWAAVLRTDWEQIADWVGCMPLALELLNRSLVLGSATVPELLEQAQHHSATSELDLHVEAIQDQLPAGSVGGVFATLALSYAKLKPNWKKAARLIAQLAPAPLPMSLVAALGVTVNQPATRAALRARSFITGGSQEFFGSMHRMMADYLRAAAAEDEGDDWLTSATALAKFFNSHKAMEPSAWPVLAALRPHAEHVLLEALSPRRLTLTVKDPAILLMVQNLGHFLQESGDHREALQFRYQLYEMMRAVNPGAQFTMQCAFWLAKTTRSLGYLGDADDLLSYVIRQSTADPAQFDADLFAGAILEQVGVLEERGDIPGARKLLERGRAYLEQSGLESEFLEQGLKNAEARILKLEGQYDAARILLDDLLAIYRQEGNLPRSAELLNEIGLVSARTGNRSMARASFEEATQISTDIFGPNHPNTLSMRRNLAMAIEPDDRSTAVEMLNDILAVSRQVLGEEHPDTALTLNSLSVLAPSKEHPEEAVAMLRSVVQRFSKLYGAEHSWTLSATSNLAIQLVGAGQVQEAESILRSVVETRRRLLGEDHRETFMAVGELARVWITLHRAADAKGALEDALERASRAFGPDHEVCTLLAHQLWQAHSLLGEFDQLANVLSERLVWLVDRDPVDLTPHQVEVRTAIVSLLSKM